MAIVRHWKANADAPSIGSTGRTTSSSEQCFSSSLGSALSYNQTDADHPKWMLNLGANLSFGSLDQEQFLAGLFALACVLGISEGHLFYHRKLGDGYPEILPNQEVFFRISLAASYRHYAPKVAHSIVDNPVGTLLQSMYFITCRQVRKKLHSSAQLLAHFY